MAQFSYNTRKQSATRMDPFFINHGYKARIDFTTEIIEADSTARNTARKFEEIWNEARINIKKAQLQYAEQANKKRIPGDSIEIGDFVLINTKNMQLGSPSKKLEERRTGPFEVVEKINDVTFRVKLPSEMKNNNSFHTSELEKVNLEREESEDEVVLNFRSKSRSPTPEKRKSSSSSSSSKRVPAKNTEATKGSLSRQFKEAEKGYKTKRSKIKAKDKDYDYNYNK